MERTKRRGGKCPTCEFSAVCLPLGSLPDCMLGAAAMCANCSRTWFFGMDPSLSLPNNAIGRYMKRSGMDRLLNCAIRRRPHRWHTIDSCPQCLISPHGGIVAFNWKRAQETRRHHVTVRVGPDNRDRYPILQIERIS